jgi:hypothetical protein
MAREQDAATMNKARDAQRKLEATRQKIIEDLAKLGREINTSMAEIGMSLGPVMPEMLVEEVGRLPGVVREFELATAGEQCTESSLCSSRTTKGWTAWR